MDWRISDIRRNDRFRYGGREDRDEKLNSLEQNGIRCLTSESDGQYWIKVIATPDDPGDSDDIAVWKEQKEKKGYET